jgi:hypothetical protein
MNMPAVAGGSARAPYLLCVLLLLASALTGCDMLGGGATQSTHFVFAGSCQSGQANNECDMHLIERLDLTVSPAAQKVAWKKTQADGSSADYTTGTNCTVIGAHDFKCDQLSQSKGTLTAATYGDSWPELWGKNVIFDGHFLSWHLWFTSSAQSPSSAAVGTFSLFANG